jgi:hypothetical protein
MDNPIPKKSKVVATAVVVRRNSILVAFLAGQAIGIVMFFLASLLK